MKQDITMPSVNIEDAAELTGYSVKYLRKLVRTKAIRSWKLNGLEVILWEDVQILIRNQRPFWITISEDALNAPTPDPAYLLYSQHHRSRLPEVAFHNKVILDDCVNVMSTMPSGIVQSVVTSPPYWGVRKYIGQQQVTWADGSNTNFGEEATAEEYVAHSLEILRHLKRVLKEDGTIWWNLGDTYQTRAYLRESSTERLEAFEGGRQDTWSKYPYKRYSSGHPYLKDKDLSLVPFQVAIGAERLGFYVRSVVVWYKDNTVPEPVQDRPTTAHEYILLLAKSRFYKYDKARAAEMSVTGEVIRRVNGSKEREIVDERNLRTVWQFPPSSSHGTHTAAFPMELPLRCLRLTTEPGDLIFDPFAGSGTTLAAAKLLGCNYLGCDIVKESVSDAERRLKNPDKPLSGPRKRGNRLKESNSEYVSDTEQTELDLNIPTVED